MKSLWKNLSINMMILSTLLCMESKNWWCMWLTLEINSISMIIFLLKEGKKESVFMYFLFQAFASTVFLMYIFNCMWAKEQSNLSLMNLVLIASIFTKIGMLPMQNWLLNSVKNFTWMAIFILFSWQKIIPILMLMKNKNFLKMVILLILSMAIISLIAMKTPKAKQMMTLSSLIHNSWMLIPMSIMKTMVILYVSLYAFISLPLIMFLKKSSLKILTIQNMSKNEKKMMITTNLSIAGIPPSMGFILKLWIFMAMMMLNQTKTMMFFLITTSCAIFYVYFQIFYKNFTMSKNFCSKKLKMKKMVKKKSSWVLLCLNILIWS